jgi:uncharacterized protein YjiS (DUF1127 family)
MEQRLKWLVALFSHAFTPTAQEPPGFGAASARLGRVVARLTQALSARRHQRLLHFELERLSDRMLADIGFSRDCLAEQIRRISREERVATAPASRSLDDIAEATLQRARRGQVTIALFGMARPAGH